MIFVVNGNHQETLFTVSKDEWETKEDTGKSMKNAFYVQWYGSKGHHLLGWSNEKIYPIALSIVKLHQAFS